MQLSFNIQKLKTGIHLKNDSATVIVINNSSANAGTVLNNKETSNGKFSISRNIAAPSGIFSIKYHFAQPGMHQIIGRINSKDNTFSVMASLYTQW
jgi:hypothetical protein